MKKQIQTFDLLIASEDNSQDAAVRIYDEGKVVFYSSTRIAGVERTEGGYLVKEVTAFAGKKYELKLLGSKKIYEGVIENSKSKNY